VNQYGCGGIRLRSMGASLHQTLLIRCGLIVFIQSRHIPPCRAVNLYGTIPGGTSFPIPQGSLSSNNNTGTGFNWTVNIVGGTHVLLFGNDDEGVGSGGFAAITIIDSMNDTCLNSNSPSSTAGNPAGGTYPTSTSKSSSNGSGSHSSS
jgi:hypothetical protein